MGAFSFFFSVIHLKKSKGQSAILITVILCLVVLAGVATSLGVFNQQSSQRNIATKSQLQSYYVAMQGIQEALGNRMVPRSNQLNYRMIQAPGQTLGVFPQSGNFFQPADPQDTSAGNMRILSYYNLSGLTFSNVRRMPTASFPNLGNPPSGINPTDILGAYRYVVVGGDSSRRADTGRYYFDVGLPGSATSKAGNNNASELKLITQPFAFPTTSSAFFIVSNGITCVPQGGGVAQPGLLVFRPYPQRPTCGTGPGGVPFRVDETNLVARVELERSQLQDLVGGIRVFEPDKLSHLVVSKPDPNRPDLNQGNIVEFPFGPQEGGAFIPGLSPNGGEFDTFRAAPAPSGLNNNRNTFPANFEDLWRAGTPQGQTNPSANVRLTKIFVYQAARTQRPLSNVGVTFTLADFFAAVDENVNVSPPGSLNTPTTINLANPLRVTSTIRLYFNGGVDFRSFYRYQLNNCSQKPELCNIQLRAGTQLRDFNFVPLLPGSDSVLITPSYIPGQTHTLSISGLRTYSGVPVPPVNIVFQVPAT